MIEVTIWLSKLKREKSEISALTESIISKIERGTPIDSTQSDIEETFKKIEDEIKSKPF